MPPLVVVGGAIANTAGRGGDTWHRLHWLLGLRRLGATVHLVEHLRDATATDATGAPGDVRQSRNAAYFSEVTSAFGLAANATLLDERYETLHGVSIAEVRQLVRDADVLVNISGHLAWRDLGVRPRRAVFVDEDPGFTQMWHVTGALGRLLDGYDAHYSIGAHVGRPSCAVPTGGITWRPLRPFAVLAEWPAVPERAFERFTTVGSWRGPCGTVEFAGVRYGVKAHEFRKFVDVPRSATASFELALEIHADDRIDRELLSSHGWRLVEPAIVAADPFTFRSYVQRSSAEFSVAKQMYVGTNSGWFSDRTIRYLASGRPALVQDTGFGRIYGDGIGLVPFRTRQDVLDGVSDIVAHYSEHGAAARAIAERYFDSDKVLAQFLDEVGVRC
jgi:hypothetical protein